MTRRGAVIGNVEVSLAAGGIAGNELKDVMLKCDADIRGLRR